MQTRVKPGAQLRLQPGDLLAVNRVGRVPQFLELEGGLRGGRPQPFHVQVKEPVNAPVEVEVGAERQPGPQVAPLEGQCLECR